MLLLAASIAVILWGAFGLYQGLHSGFSGGIYDPEYLVPGVFPGGLADKSGFQAGDRVISVEGIPIEELGMESRWPRSLSPRIGQSLRFVVERNGERIPLDVVYPPPFQAAVQNRISAAIVGLLFLGIGLWAFLTVGSLPASILAHIGLAAGVRASLALGPNLGSWNGVQSHISMASGVLVYIFALRFFVIFPKRKRVSHSQLATWIIYGAWACLLAYLILELIVHPALYYKTGSVANPLMLAYGILILAAIIHTVVKSPRKELRESGMYLILVGLLFPVGAIVSQILGLYLPSWVYSFAILAIPLTMALAVRKHNRI